MMKLPINNQKSNKQSGFTLLEVLITLIILAIGLLGLAGLQAVSSNQNHSAYNRSQATQLAYSMSDRMRANKVAINNYLTSFMAPSIAPQRIGCTAGGCSTADMAANDLFEWNLALNSVLPHPDPPVELGNIAVNGATFTITINWDDNRDGNVDANDPNFQMSFQP